MSGDSGWITAASGLAGILAGSLLLIFVILPLLRKR